MFDDVIGVGVGVLNRRLVPMILDGLVEIDSLTAKVDLLLLHCV